MQFGNSCLGNMAEHNQGDQAAIEWGGAKKGTLI